MTFLSDDRSKSPGPFGPLLVAVTNGPSNKMEYTSTPGGLGSEFVCVSTYRTDDDPDLVGKLKETIAAHTPDTDPMTTDSE